MFGVRFSQKSHGKTINFVKYMFIGVHRCGHKLLLVVVRVGSVAYFNPELVKVIFEGVG
jgi:hypothetical protein